MHETSLHNTSLSYPMSRGLGYHHLPAVKAVHARVSDRGFLRAPSTPYARVYCPLVALYTRTFLAAAVIRLVTVCRVYAIPKFHRETPHGRWHIVAMGLSLYLFVANISCGNLPHNGLQTVHTYPHFSLMPVIGDLSTSASRPTHRSVIHECQWQRIPLETTS